jgi:hypothetical protein
MPPHAMVLTRYRHTLTNRSAQGGYAAPPADADTTLGRVKPVLPAAALREVTRTAPHGQEQGGCTTAWDAHPA